MTNVTCGTVTTEVTTLGGPAAAVTVWVKEIVVTGGAWPAGGEETGTIWAPVVAVTVSVAGVGIRVMVLGTAVQMAGFCGMNAAQTPAK